jgi:hypothetical protein
VLLQFAQLTLVLLVLLVYLSLAQALQARDRLVPFLLAAGLQLAAQVVL